MRPAIQPAKAKPPTLMPFTYHIDPDQRLVLVTIAGEVTGRDILGAITAYTSSPDWVAGYDRLWDGRGITVLALSPADVEALLGRAQQLLPQFVEGRLAIVVKRDLDYTIARFFQRKLSEFQTRVFDEPEDALAWLGKKAPGGS